jgi:hypothetical protein
VVRAIHDGEYRDSVRSAVSLVTSEHEATEFMDSVADDIEAWSEAGIELTYDDPSIVEVGEYGRVNRDRKYKQLGGYDADIEIAEHMQLPCHITEIHVGGKGWGDRPEVRHWCKTFSLHEAKGKSKLKHDTATQVQTRKEDSSAINRTIRDARTERIAQAQAWKPTKTQLKEMGILDAGDYISYDDHKMIGRDILELDKPADITGMTANTWWHNEVKAFIEEATEEGLDRALLRIRLNHQVDHIKGNLSKHGWEAGYLLDDIEVPDDGA